MAEWSSFNRKTWLTKPKTFTLEPLIEKVCWLLFIMGAASTPKRSAIPTGGHFLVYNYIEEKGEWILMMVSCLCYTHFTDLEVEETSKRLSHLLKCTEQVTEPAHREKPAWLDERTECIFYSWLSLPSIFFLSQRNKYVLSPFQELAPGFLSEVE